MNTFDVRIWSILTRVRTKKTTYQLRWVVSKRIFSADFDTKALADSRRAELLLAQRRGEGFDTESGLPESEARKHKSDVTWYDHAVAFLDMKWPALEAGSRRALATSLATATLALVTDQRGMPDYDDAFTALVNWSFNRHARMAGDPSAEFAAAIDWVRGHSVPITALREPRTARAAYDATTTSPSGQPYAANTYKNKVKGLNGAIKYAIELDLLERNPLDRISTPPPRTTTVVDSRVVINPTQARTLLAAVGQQGTTGARYVAFFATMYFAALRPSEVLALRKQDCFLPENGWGRLRFAESSPYAGGAWTDSGDDSPRKALKHRAKHESRNVPAHPELVAHLRAHIEKFGTARDGRLFVRANGGDIRYATFANIWSMARKAAFSSEQFFSPLGKRPYDLRHAAVSTWLNAGVSAPQVAEWAGHSVDVLLSVYAKCIDGHEQRDIRRIEDQLRD
ncbi:tyrosine-type recombinase/integrase [Catenulispora sp. NL8]|uniref:Tyrosine-type recombinase/integrase n=1 Tax=Catenulispora pinistramenti TaxID=2705254 RepID=A0ABS5KI28_9ACTN|nr:tyrosine-type recombinase/integrase [Catenulispora pinistramenti]MBS2545540.1 tyrosine-type recombinase/integrase [Catenulispora pinistramenti]